MVRKLSVSGRFRRWLRFLLIAIELAVIVAWAVDVTSEFRETTKYDVVSGNDYFVSVQGRFFWNHVKSCGTCALWNGDSRGGSPSYVDANTDMFHPLVAVPAYLAGPLQGSKISIVLAIIMGGVAVWWLGLELGAGTIARVSTACMAVASGSMIGRLEEGLVVVVTATAAAFLMLPALLRTSKQPIRRNSALLGLVLGLTIISGQGYIQLGIAIMSPLVAILIVRNPHGWKRSTVHFLLAGVIGLLISMIFIYPFARVYEDFAKVFDVGFGSYQPMKYQLLNLAISDGRFLNADYLDKLGFAAWYVNYIGWIPIGFALLGVGIQWRRSKRITLFLGLSFLAALWVGSGEPFRLLAEPSFVSQETRIFAWSIRIPSFVSALAIPPLLGFAAVAIDESFHATVRFPNQEGRWWAARFPLSSIGTFASRAAIVVLLIFSLRDLHEFAKDWVWTEHIDPQIVESFTDQLATDSLAWVSPMNNDARLQLFGMDAGLKWSDSWRSWYFEGQPFPAPYLAVQSASEEREGMRRIGEWEGYSLFENLDGNQYVTASGGGTCSANGEGGHIDVVCTTENAGQVVVQELNRGSWVATLNGQEVTVHSNESQWITVDVPPGELSIQFRYRPTDFWIGAALSAMGLLICAVLIILPSRIRFRFYWSTPSLERQLRRYSSLRF